MTVNYLDTDGPAFTTPMTASNRTIRDTPPNDSLSTAIVRAVEAATGVDALDLPPLYDAIDPDALDALVRSPDQPLRVTFEYAGLAVTVDSDGDISLTRPDES